ncbi:hypothetical protein [Saccharomonospora piscinae]|uniref:hypothetical protein n=1 Tax=Saccharomonospora piscinae TaxID=687388 RepID=UPI001423AA81|nr:hypothetical protein [Saccharomonospora piscinae]
MAAAKKGELVPRPARKSEYEIRFATARIWFYVHGRTVFLEQVHTSNPNETK